MKKLYRIAQLPFIGEAAKQVYKSEHKIAEELYVLGRAISDVLLEADIDRLSDVYREQIPEALAAVLSRFDRSSALAAILGYLRKDHGAEVHDGMELALKIKGLVVRLPETEAVKSVDLTTLPMKGRSF